jgi:probable rRNA maturation factor
VHGLLHLCGYDDQTESERRLMRKRERAILKLLGD